MIFGCTPFPSMHRIQAMSKFGGQVTNQNEKIVRGAIVDY